MDLQKPSHENKPIPKQSGRFNREIRLTPYGEQLLRERLSHSNSQSPAEIIERALELLREREQVARAGNLADFDVLLDALAKGSERIPDLPDEAFSQPSIYEDCGGK